MSTLPEHGTHTHCLYGLTCRQFEDMLAACMRSCQACGTAASDLRAHKLAIDHDHAVGKWAVRGLLCGGCNATLRYDLAVPDWGVLYLGDPWWKRMLAERGLDAAMPEPAEYRVLDFFDRVWSRNGAGWSTGAWRCPVLTWPELLAKYGPHNLKPLNSDITGWALPAEKSISGTIRHGDGTLPRGGDDAPNTPAA